MSDRFFRYLTREHARLERLLDEQRRRPLPDDAEIARLKKAKLMVKDQMARWQADCSTEVAA